MIRPLAIVLAAAALNGCVTDNTRTPPSPPSVVSVGDLAQATRGATSFAFMPHGRIVPADTRLDTTGIETEIRATIEGVITGRGYGFTTPERADLWIGYAAALESSLSDQEIQRLVGFTPGSPDGTGLERGTVLLGISRPNSRGLLWSAGMQANADLSISEIERRQRVNAAVDQLLIGLPNR
jgi:hypothetical protein